MYFDCDGRTYDSKDLIALKGNACYPLGMFVSPDHQNVFGMIFPPGSVMEVRVVSGPELRSVAELTGDADLLESLELECACTYPGVQ